MKSKKGIILLSGGLDSATCLFLAKEMGYEIITVSFHYSQRHQLEERYAKKLAEIVDVKESIYLTIDLSSIGGSALTDDIDVPKGGSDIGKPDLIPVTYVPARNLIFLSLGAAVAEVKKANYIFIGVNALDYSGYPDCRGDFITSFEKTCNLASKTGREGQKIEIKTPLIDLTKADIIKKGLSLGVPYEFTWSCYDPQEERPCGGCDACILRKKGFDEVGVQDPLLKSLR